MSWYAFLILVYRESRNVLVTQIFSLYYRIVFFLHPAVTVGDSLQIRGPVKHKIDPRAQVVFGRQLRINSGYRINPFGGERRTIINVNKNGRLTLGNNVGISNSTIICCLEVTIGDDVIIGGGCNIFDTDFHSIQYQERMKRPDTQKKHKPVTIGRGVFIGGYVKICKGVTIGDYSVIGTGSVVTRDIPSKEIWAGNPARFIRKIEQI